MRCVALSSNNVFVPGSDEDAANSPAIASLIENGKLNGAWPQRYLTEMPTCLVNGWPQARIDQLMPWNRTTPPNG